MLGVRGTYLQVMRANGPAQHIVYAIWGTLMAGIFYDACPAHIPNAIIYAWGVASLAVIVAVVWLPKTVLKAVLMLDMFLCAALTALFVMHPPHDAPMVYMTSTAGGMVAAQRNVVSSGLTISEDFQIAALVWLFLCGAYLANLVDRQILERRRIDARA